MASPEEPVTKLLNGPTLVGLADDLLADILLRLLTLADVGRAATVCRTFRGVIADRSFRPRLRSLHRAPFLGFFYRGEFYPAEAPHPSAPYARAFMRAADLSFSFLPHYIFPPPLSSVLDFRDALLELFQGYAIVDPVSRTYSYLPPVPVEKQKRRPQHLQLFLVPAGDEEETSSFRVICIDACRDQLVAFVFSWPNNNGGWRAFPCQNWSSACWGASDSNLDIDDKEFSRKLCWRYFASGYVYWALYWMNKFLVFDTCRMEFSFVDYPPDCRFKTFFSAIAESGDGRVEMVVLKVGHEYVSLCSTRQGNFGGGNAWEPMMMRAQVQAPPGYCFLMEGATERYSLLIGLRDDTRLSNEKLEIQYFLFEHETMRLDKMCTLNRSVQRVNLYTGFPPSLSLPSL
ncbi:hypothetical protein QOZ80_7AG0572190 [Eleusine coracana subsp. coracana]|nr:hypothetical protein QOZ80_7AG0572190 [Eleusine coracana subsp. coracana]